MKKIYLFIALLCVSSISAFAQPTVAANTPPARNAADVISLFSNAYSNVTVDTWRTSWSQGTLTDLQIAGNDTKFYENINFVGVEFYATATVNATAMQTFHIDVWTGNATTFRVKLVDFGANNAFAGGDDTEHEIVLTPLTQNAWNSYDIPFASFTGLATREHLAQLIFSAIPVGSASAYVDNVYMYRAANAPTITGFSIPTQVSNNAPFVITAPMSNSTGAFTYTSANPAVATISGNTITLVGAGTSLITASQAAAPPYSSGSTTALLTVTPAVSVPVTAAPTPTQPAANVISMFSNAYTNVPVDIWRTSWSQADFADVQVAGNDTKLYTNLGFVGVETVNNQINATAMQFYHIDVWSANATEFKVKLVDFGANGIYQGGDDSEHELSLTPFVQAGWNSFDIPMSSFVGLTSRAHLAQMIFVGTPFGSTTAYVDNVYFYNVPSTTPMVAAPTPTRLAANVISLFSNAYTNAPVDTWLTSWSAAALTDLQIAGNDTKLYSNLDFAGIETVGANMINATPMDGLHIDVWTPDASVFRVKVVDFGANGSYGGGDDSESELSLTPLNQGAWNSFDIPFSSLTGLTARGHLAQLIISAVPSGASKVYIDNVYFYKVPPTTPMVAAPNPPNRAPADVISIYSGQYTDLTGVVFDPYWGQPVATVITDELIAGNPTKKYDLLNYQGTQLASTIDLTTFDKLHLDIWTPNCTSFKVSLVNTNIGQEQAFTITPTIGGWNSIDIPLTAYSSFVAAINLNAIGQLKFEAIPAGSSTVFIDNIYFSKGSPLPIILSSFDAVKKGNASQLDWHTSMESNNKGFHVQRSKNATNWETLDFINGVGYSNLDNAYNFVDNKPTKGVNYYRLKQEDFNGRTSYSDIKVLRFTEKEELNLTIFPNPTKETVYVDLSSFGNGAANLSIVDAAGKIVMSKNISILNGNYNASINLKAFAKGSYILQIKNTENNISKILVVE